MITDNIENYERTVYKYKSIERYGNSVEDRLLRLSRMITYLEPAKNQLKNILMEYFLKKGLSDIKKIIITSGSIDVVIDREYRIYDYELEILQSVGRPFSIWFNADITVTYVLETRAKKDNESRMRKDVTIDDFLEVLHKAKEEHGYGNIKIGTVTDITDKMNRTEKQFIRYKYSKSLQYAIQLITNELTLKSDEEMKDES